MIVGPRVDSVFILSNETPILFASQNPFFLTAEKLNFSADSNFNDDYNFSGDLAVFVQEDLDDQAHSLSCSIKVSEFNNIPKSNDDLRSIGGLPDVQGFREGCTLHQAMIQDDSGGLQTLVERFVGAKTRQERLSVVESIIYTWAGEDEEKLNLSLSSIDVRKIGVLQWFYGFDIGAPQGSGNLYTEIYEDMYQDLVDCVYYQLSAKGHLQIVLQELTWQKNLETDIWKGDFSRLAKDFFEHAKSSLDSADDFMLDVIQAIRGINVYTFVNTCCFRASVDEYIQSEDFLSMSGDTILS